MKAELIDFMGDDLRVVNSARVSFAKESEWIDLGWNEDMTKYNPRKSEGNSLSEKDQKLIKYLAEHNHWTPFSHVMITMRETVPIFVARQRFKHMVGFTYNEESRRYVSDDPTFFIPDVWRKAAENKKQGSSEETIDNLNHLYGNEYKLDVAYNECLHHCYNLYKDMIDGGVAPEQARMVLPQSMYTSYYVTGSLAAWARAYRLRSDPHAQQEIRNLAEQWDRIISNIPELKHSWEALAHASQES